MEKTIGINIPSCITFGIFALIGVLLLGSAIADGYLAYQLDTNRAKATGTIIKLETSDNDPTIHYPVVRFTTQEGKEITFRSARGSNTYSDALGESVKVLYLPANPEGARIGGFFEQYFEPVVLGGLGIGFTSPVIAWVLISYFRSKKKTRLLGQSRLIKARIIEVKLNTTIKINEESPFRIICQWHNKSTNKVHVFFSENLFFDPGPYIKTKDISVYVNDQDMKDYYVDIRFLPKKF